MEQNKLRMEIIKDGKLLKHVRTESTLGKAGYYTDIYRDEDGYFHHIERLSNAIKFTTHSRSTGDGNMISFGINFKFLLNDLFNNCTTEELDRLIKKCEYSLSKAKTCYEKESPEEFNNIYAKAVCDKVEEIIDETTFKNYNPSTITKLQELLQAPRMNENIPFSNAIKTKIVIMQNAMEEIENQ